MTIIKQTHAGITDAGRLLYKIFYLSLYLLGFEKGYSKFACERGLETEHNWNILTLKLCSTGARESTLLGAGFPYYISSLSASNFLASAQQSAFCSIRRPYITFKLPCGDMYMPPHPHNFFRYLATGMCHFRYLWNGLCDRHRVEITVMQFRGHSLPVRQSMRV